MALTLGIYTGHEASAVLFDNSTLVAAVSDERISRIKNDGGKLSDLAIDSVLSIAKRQRGEIERLALLYTFFPEEYFRRETWTKEIERRLVRLRRRLTGHERPQMLIGGYIERLQKLGKSFESHFHQKDFLSKEGFPNAVLRFFDHHDSHAMPAAFYSGFDSAAVITMDGNGDHNIHHTSCVYTDGALQRLHTSNAFGTSAGIFYGHITRLLGFKVLRHEGKVVGLAAMGDPKPLYAAFTKALRLAPDGLHLDSDFSGPDRRSELRRYHYLEQAIQGHTRENVSAAAQKVLEDVVVTLVRNFLAHSSMKNVALNGGVFANVKLNQRIAELQEVGKIFVFPAMSDTGNSVGAALLDLAVRQPDSLARARHPLQHVYLGPAYDDAEIANRLRAAGVSGQALSRDALTRTTAQAIHAGKVVGWFQGRMEFGPRALGNRSMLARPTEASINDWLNKRLDRSEFMPFAPSVLEEHAEEIFIGVEKAKHTARFMTITFDVRPEWRTRIPAVVHIDGTARPQLVNRETNALYHDLISAYRALSGIPLVLNTSFNVHEEPIVCTPKEAIQAFIEKRVDCLGIGSFWLEHA